jgi:hypothetical protein
VTTKTPALPDHSVAQVGGLALLVSLLSFFYYFQHNDLLLYGDAVAHINIARRVFDSQTPGLLQLGTVWLPLPHLLMVPFIVSNSLWQNGAGGSFPSMVAYVFAVVGIFRLARVMLEASSPATSSSESSTKTAATVGAWTAAFVYGANLNLIYMQTTAMTESLYLCLFIWAVVFFVKFVRERRSVGPSDASKANNAQASISLQQCGWCLAAAELTRYDGWVLSAAIGVAVLMIAMRRDPAPGQADRSLRRMTLKFLLIISCVPVFWFAYNRAVYGNALEFANGAHSAKAIEQRVSAPNPALHNAGVAAIYFLKSAQLNMADGNWGRLWVAAAFVALLLAAWKLRPQVAVILLLWIPLVFYALSIAYGSVPIHVSVWWPFATFNQRYGLQLLPMFAVSAGALAAFAYQFMSKARHSGKIVAVLIALIVASYASVWNAKPQCFAEAERNWRIRSPLDSAVERVVKQLPRHSMFLMDISEHVGIMQQAGIPLRQVVNSENHRMWKRPDPEGLWERALADPQHYVDFVIAFDGDEVDRYANKTKLAELTELHATGRPPARIYAARVALNSPQ